MIVNLALQLLAGLGEALCVLAQKVDLGLHLGVLMGQLGDVTVQISDLVELFFILRI